MRIRITGFFSLQSKKSLIIHITIAVTALMGMTIGMPDSPSAVYDVPFIIESPTVEEYVREYFKDEPVLAEVARCESTFRHFDKNGDILRGVRNSDDVGVMQINEYFHLKTASELGYNLYSLDGNLSYARHLYKKEGTRPWKASAKCWKIGEHLALK